MTSIKWQVLDIQKRAAEMGLNCIISYKLDALKSVRRIESDDSAASQIPEDMNNVETDLSSGLKLSSTATTVEDALLSQKDCG